MDPYVNEAETREQLIDKALEKAGWDLGDPSQVGEEIPVDQENSPEYQALMARLRREGYDLSDARDLQKSLHNHAQRRYDEQEEAYLRSRF